MSPVLFCQKGEFMYNSYYAVIFAGINTDSGTFEQVGKEITSGLKLSQPGCKVNTLTIYPYDASVSGDTVADALQVVKNAYTLCGNTIKCMANDVIKNYAGEDLIFFTGYSGGGVAATKTAEKLMLMNFKPISKIIRIGSPVLTVGKPLYGRTVDLMLPGDPVVQLEIPRFFKNLRPYQCLLQDHIVTRYVHSCYFKEDLKDADGKTNLTKTVNKILKFVKN